MLEEKSKGQDWISLLDNLKNEKSKRKEMNFIVFGDSKSHKSTLIRNICNNSKIQNNKNSEKSESFLQEYFYLNITQNSNETQEGIASFYLFEKNKNVHLIDISGFRQQ